MLARQCGATTSSGGPCKRAPIVGGTVCALHGGRAPQTVRVALDALAAFRLPAVRVPIQVILDWEADACDVCGRAKGDPRPVLAAAKMILDRTGLPGATALQVSRVEAEPEPWTAWLLPQEIEMIVACGERAWHAGASTWKGRERCNDYSIGIELEGTDDLPYEPAQYETLTRLSKALCRRYPISELVGHSDIAPGRKSDPGPAFDWSSLRRLLGSLDVRTPAG